MKSCQRPGALLSHGNFSVASKSLCPCFGPVFRAATQAADLRTPRRPSSRVEKKRSLMILSGLYSLVCSVQCSIDFQLGVCEHLVAMRSYRTTRASSQRFHAYWSIFIPCNLGLKKGFDDG